MFVCIGFIVCLLSVSIVVIRVLCVKFISVHKSRISSSLGVDWVCKYCLSALAPRWDYVMSSTILPVSNLPRICWAFLLGRELNNSSFHSEKCRTIDSLNSAHEPKILSLPFLCIYLTPPPQLYLLSTVQCTGCRARVTGNPPSSYSYLLQHLLSFI